MSDRFLRKARPSLIVENLLSDKLSGKLLCGNLGAQSGRFAFVIEYSAIHGVEVVV